MLSIGEFSGICRVSAKTLRYYAEIGLLQPAWINPENGYRYYSAGQLETMLLISRLKSYNFSLEEIKAFLGAGEPLEERLCRELVKKRRELEAALSRTRKILTEIDADISNIRQGRPIMSYMEGIDVGLSEAPSMRLVSVRSFVQEDEFPGEYAVCFNKLFRRIQEDGLTVSGPPMVLFHSGEFSELGMDTEFAVPVKEQAGETRDFCPGLCLKTTLRGPYSGLPSVYARQREWAEREGYESAGALFEAYVTDPSMVREESGLITEVYLPVVRSAKEKRSLFC